MTHASPPMTANPSTPPVWPLPDGHPLRDYLRLVLSQQPCALCLDIDGTISETAPTVDAAVLLPGMRELLVQATKVFDLVATISGRAVADQRRMIGVQGVWHVGHHGYEWEELDQTAGERRIILWPKAAPFLASVASALDDIETALAPRLPGLWMERKGITGGIHWRLADNHAAAEDITLPVVTHIANKYGLRIRASKLAVEIYPPVLTDKGAGIERLIEMHDLRSTIYLGDDISDTDAFLSVQSQRWTRKFDGIGIGVLNEFTPPMLIKTADLLIERISDVPKLLAWLLAKRQIMHYA